MELNGINNSTDQELISRALDHDSEAFEELFMRYKDYILKMYLQKTGNNFHDSNDMLQETFVKVYINLHKYNPIFTFNQWVYTIARNTFIDYTRKRRDNILSIDQEQKGGARINPASTTPTPEEDMIITQSNTEFDEMLSQLNPQYQKIIMMRFFNEYSYEEISEKLSMPLGTVKTQIHRARECLYKLICKNDTI